VQPSTLEIRKLVPLGPYTTLGVGGPAHLFCEVVTEDELLEAIRFARENSLKIFVLGGGSNLLVGDSGFDGLVIHISIKGQTKSVTDGNWTRYEVAAGVDWNSFVLETCEQGIGGVACLSGIPGSVGGTPVQNVGAYGQEVSDTIEQVRALDLDTEIFVALTREQCGFGYRRSIFNSTHRGRYIVTQVSFRFDRRAKPNLTYADLRRHFGEAATEPTAMDVYDAVRFIRHQKGMLIVEGEADCRSAGSFFKNPVVTEEVFASIAAALGAPAEEIPHWPSGEGLVKLPAAWLLERAGFPKGFTMGSAGISSRHTLALINRGGATATEIVALRNRIQQRVQQQFGILLEQEPVMLGRSDIFS
jgi:UDP-N-acetylmuramate dehydrogenase